MFISKLKTKLLAIFLIWLMLFTNPAYIVAAQVTTATTATEVEKSADVQDSTILTVDKLAVEQKDTTSSSENNEHLTDQEKKLKFSNSLLDYYLQKKQGPKWLETTDVQFYFTEDHKPIYAVESLQPFSKVKDNGSFWFWQGRYAHESDNSSTANLGVGWRKLSADKSSILGVNAFYDYGFEYDLARIGLGAEYFKNLAEYRVNWYHPVSGDKQIGVSYLNEGILYSYIHAVEGMDVELGTSFTHMPWLKVYAGGYYWDNKYHEDEKGYKLRSTWQLTPRITVELGYLGSNLSHSSYGQIKYQLADNIGPSLFGKSNKQEPSSADISSKLWQKVQRENDIKTETYTKLVAYKGNIKATITNSTNSTPLAGAVVQAYQNGSAVGSAVTTDSNGEALVSGLSVGTYTVLATYASSTGTSSSITVTKDQTTAAAVSLAVTGGSATITVLNAASQAVSGASVTATLSSTTVASAPKSMIDRVLGVSVAYAGTSSFSVTTTTNSSGVAKFNNLPPGTYHFSVAQNSLTMMSHSVAITSGGSSAVTVLLPTSGGDIEATVKDSSGAVLSGATVKVLSGSSVVATGTTNSNGVALLGGIAAGTYTLSASLTNYDSNTTSVTVKEDETTSSSIALTSQGRTVQITVNDGTNAISGANVSTVVNGTTYSGTTNSSGVAIISGIPLGTYTFTASAAGYTNNTGSIAVTASGGSGTISLRGAGGNVAITVNDGTNAILGATVSTTVNGTTYSGTTNGSGVATISGVPLGAHDFVANAIGYATETGNIAVTTSGGSGTIVLNGDGRVSITVNDGTNAISGATVSTTVNGITYLGTTNGSGVATINGLPLGTYPFTASATNYTSNTASVAVTTTGGSGTISLIGLGNVSITVYDKSTNSPNYTGTTPFVGGTVSVTINGSTYNAVTNSSGVAAFNNLPVGTYTFNVTSASYSNWIDTSAHKDITIAVGSTASTTISVYGKGGATVTVTDGTNAPISGATVKFYREGSEAMANLTSDTAGKVSCWFLITGIYNVKVTKDSSTVTSSNFVVSPGLWTDVSVTLQ